MCHALNKTLQIINLSPLKVVHWPPKETLLRPYVLYKGEFDTGCRPDFIAWSKYRISITGIQAIFHDF